MKTFTLRRQNLIKRMNAAAKQAMERKQREAEKLAALAEQAKSREERKQRRTLIQTETHFFYDSGKLLNYKWHKSNSSRN